MRRITIKDCNIQLEYIKTKLLANKINIEIKQNGLWKNLYQSGNCIVSAKTCSELYYQLVAFKQGIELAINEKLGA